MERGSTSGVTALLLLLFLLVLHMHLAKKPLLRFSLFLSFPLSSTRKWNVPLVLMKRGDFYFIFFSLNRNLEGNNLTSLLASDFEGFTQLRIL